MKTLVFLFLFVVGTLTETITIDTKFGKVAGLSKNFTTRHGKNIFAFRGIRYAEPPIGKLRFEAPVPIKPWHGNTFNAVDEGPGCHQPITVDFPVSEDCLRLNIYTTQLPKHHSNLRPVIVFIHPGGFYGVSGQSLFTGPEYLLDHDVVLVTINYRLATLGFLSWGDEILPGNYGMKDQVAALRFVKANIVSYGGNPKDVTIMGYSAGSTSVALHLISPMTDGLFQKAIAMSASPTGTYKYPTHQKHIAIKQAQLLDCPSNSSKEIVDCLRTKPAQTIASTFFSFFEIGFDPQLIWSPVVETTLTEKDRYLTQDPVEAFLKGNYKKVPFMTGITALEYVAPAYHVMNNKTLLDFWNTKFSVVAPVAFIYERNTIQSSEISRKIQEFYFPNKTVDLMGLREAYADGIIGFSVHRLVNLISKTNTFNTYYYKFSYEGTYSYFYLPNTTTAIGPVHHDDLIYLFTMPFRKFPFIGLDDPAAPIVECETLMWTNFAKTGNPNKPGTCKGQQPNIWKPFTPTNKLYLDINKELKMESNMFPDRYALWDQIIPLPKLS